MFLMLAAILIGGWMLFTAWKFYKTIDWTEAPDPSPDLQGMHKRQAELMHIQDVLTQAHEDGKLSQKVIEEINHYCDSEIQAMQAVENAWKNRPRRTHL
jgi:hypothetical protein